MELKNWWYIIVGVGLLCVFLVFQNQPLVLSIVLLNIGFTFIGFGLGSGIFGAKTFQKRKNGTLTLISYLIYWPYLVVDYIILYIIRVVRKENVYDEILSGLYLGGRLWLFDKKDPLIKKIDYVLDLTSEFTEPFFFRNKAGYLCIPLIDHHAPTLDELTYGVTWLVEQHKKGYVYVHCAMGHGRSAIFVVAYVMFVNRLNSVEHAIEFVKTKRPVIRLNKKQIEVIEKYRLHNKITENYK
ncbi:MAG: dual specificity protein phosphatase family protein [Candidatus Magnetoovum sp. WYHC-5]|nr:dual specificity protein phosphatase family protein [Candidatus Magnetoovum sp. WYHC-5]